MDGKPSRHYLQMERCCSLLQFGKAQEIMTYTYHYDKMMAAGEKQDLLMKSIPQVRIKAHFFIKMVKHYILFPQQAQNAKEWEA